MSRYKITHPEARIRHTLGQMPYGALERIRQLSARVGMRDGNPAPIDLEDVAAYLEGLGELLHEVVAARNAEQDELRRLKDDIAAVRRVFGLSGSR